MKGLCDLSALGYSDLLACVYLEPGKVLYEHVGGAMHQVKQLVLLRILVLIQESLDRVRHQSRIMTDPKLLLPQSPVPLHVTRVPIKRLVLFVNIGFVCSLNNKQQLFVLRMYTLNFIILYIYLIINLIFCSPLRCCFEYICSQLISNMHIF